MPYKDKNKENSRNRARYNTPEGKKYKADYYIRNKDSIKSAKLRCYYGISLEGKKKMYEDQNKCCDSCNRPYSIDELQVDHKHIPGYKQLDAEEKRKYVRSLLCRACNSCAGYANDNPHLLRMVANYLDKHSPSLTTTHN